MVVLMMDKKQRQQMEQINQKVFTFSGVQMQTVYNKQKTALNEINAAIGQLYLMYAVNGYIVANRLKKRIIVNEFNQRLKAIYSNLGNSEASNVKNILFNDYSNVYKGLSIFFGEPNPDITDRVIEKAINATINGELYSDRIWKNKDKLTKLLKKALKNILNGDLTVDEAGKQIRNIFNVTAYDSQRLLNSEVTRILGQASTDLCKQLDIEKQIWSATFENSCKECIALDGKIFKVGKAPDLPVHSNCRCLLLPYIE